ncbi:MAG: hypothetical protein NTV98_01900, partial [Candidatus Roizmanbacteria bacterium]|nr:hypothetical protein [Candidatus Roizmanbacteria bacterium]
FLTKYDVTFSLNPEIYSNPGIQSPTNSFSGEVIPAYIDGIAYDVDGKPIIEAVVGLYPSYSENAMFYTTTDQNGKYMIGSQHIPESQYSLRYKKNTGEVVQVDTSTFIKQNVGYFVTNEIKPFNQRKATLIEEKNSQELFTKIVGNKTPDMTSVAKGSKNNSGLKNELRNSTQQSSSTLLDSAQRAVGAQGIIIGLVILILVIISGGVFVILKSKKAPMQ